MRASAETTPWLLDAVNWASQAVTSIVNVGEIGACSAGQDFLGSSTRGIGKKARVSVHSIHENLARASTGTSSTSYVTNTKLTPTTNFTVHRARTMVAVNSHRAGATFLAAMLGFFQRTTDNEVSVTARDTADRVAHPDIKFEFSAPCSFNAINGTFHSGAGLHGQRIGTFLTTEKGPFKSTGPGSDAQAASCRTNTKLTPGANNAVDGAIPGVAVFGPTMRTTFLATECRSSSGRASESLDARITCGRADASFSPFTFDTVQRAFKIFASLNRSLDVSFQLGAVGSNGALLAAVQMRSQDALTGLETATASLRASNPGVPQTNVARYGTHEGVAVLGFQRGRTCLATVQRFDVTAGACLGTSGKVSGATLGALTPVDPVAYNTVHLTWRLVASADLHTLGALGAGNDLLTAKAVRVVKGTMMTVNRINGNSARTRMRTGTAGVGTIRPDTPIGNFTVHGTRAMVTIDGLGSNRTFLAAVQRRN